METLQSKSSDWASTLVLMNLVQTTRMKTTSSLKAICVRSLTPYLDPLVLESNQHQTVASTLATSIQATQ